MIVNPIAANYLFISNFFIKNIFFLSLIFVVSSPVSAAEKSIHITNKAIQALQLTAAGNIHISRAQRSPYISFLRANAGSSVIDFSMSRLPEDRARSFLQYRKEAFVDTAVRLDLVETHVESSGDRSIVRMQQMYNGVFVRGGEVVVQMNSSGITAVNSKLISGLDNVDTLPAISQENALAKAKSVVLELYGVSDVTFSVPKLEIFNLGALNGQPGLSQLAWFIELTGATIREYIWINAETGKTIKNFSQIARVHSRVRATFDVLKACDLDNVTLPVLSETDLVDADPDANAAHDIVGQAYDFFDTVLGRDGIADTSIPATPKTIQSMVNYCDAFSGFVQPTGITLELAGWNGDQMFYATGSVVDDIVGHEYTHAVIEYSANFNLIGESGALAESFSDIFGETIDLEEVTGNDVLADKWKIGEDVISNVAAGPFRDLSDPGLSGFPAKMSDEVNKVYCGLDNDIFIHTNSSILSHAFVLLADGGTFESTTYTGIGILKSAKIFYEGLKLLTSNSQFKDAYNALRTAASTLFPPNPTISVEQTALNAVLDGVELNVASPCGGTQIPYCSVGSSPEFVFQDGFENIGLGNWTSSTLVTGVDHWNSGSGLPPGDVYHSGTDPFATLPIPRQGIYALYADGSRRMGASAVSMTDTVAVGKDYRIQFEHNYAFENLEADGGLIEYSVNEGEWTDAGPLIVSGMTYTPDKVISGLFGNPLGGRAGFLNFMLENDTATLPVYDYASTQLDLNLIPETPVSIKFRFVVGTDPSTDARGWVIDDFTIYTCESQIFKINQGPIALTTNESGVDTALFDVTLESAPTGNVTINLSSSLPTEGVVTVPASQSLLFTPLNWNSPQTVTVIGQDDAVIDGDIPYVVRLTGVAVDLLDEKFNGTVDVAITNIDDDVPATASGGGGGGCSLATKNKFDPILPLLVLLSIVYLLVRKKTAILTA